MNVDFITAIKLFFANYANFNGRSTRAEFWWAQLFLFLVNLVLNFVLKSVPFLGVVWSLAILLPSLAIATRRLHDINRSGWWLFGYYALTGILAAIMGFVLGGAVYAAFFGLGNPSAMSELIGEAVLTHLGMFLSCGLIILVLAIWYLIWMVKPSGPDNQYGPNPYGEQF